MYKLYSLLYGGLINDLQYYLLYDIAIIQWITSCLKNRITTRVITLSRVDVTSLTTSVSTMRFLIEIMIILKAIKNPF